MISIREISLEYLMPTLGVPKFTYNQVKFCCPKCDRGGKYNLEIHTENLIFNCWSCHYKGYITKLLSEYGASDGWKNISEIKNSYSTSISSKSSNNFKLPQSIVPFHLSKEVENYLINERKIDKSLLIQRKVSYVYSEEERLFNHIVFPFYDNTGNNLIAFSVQNFKTKKYKNYGEQNFVPYVQFINVDYPITLTEGIYDAYSIPNSIPLLGTSINKAVLEFLQGKKVILALDNEVSEEEINIIIEQLKQYCVEVIYVFNTEEYKDLNKFKQEDNEQLIKRYKYAVETILENY